MTLRIPPDRRAGRLDRTLADELGASHSRSEIARLIRSGLVLLDGRPAKVATEVQPGSVVTIDFPEPEPSDVPAEDLPLRIVYEDSFFLVVDKPAGMVTHPAGSLRSGTLVNALLHHVRDLSGIGGVLRPGIVHRLDKGTSGLLVVAKSDESHRELAGQLRDRTLHRIYEAVVWGKVTPTEFRIDAPIARHPRDRKRMAVVEGGKEARTEVRVLAATELASHLRLKLDTGRTHQIRVHLQHRGHPLVGDATYGGRRRTLRGTTAAVRRAADSMIAEISRPALHARRLELSHPDTGERLSFESLLPEDFRRVVRSLDSNVSPAGGEIG